MSINRRELVKLGGVLGGVAAMAAAQGKGLADEPPEVGQQVTARGKVATYTEGFQPTFTLSEMPEGIKSFLVEPRVTAPLGRILLLAAEKGWEVHVTYTHFRRSEAAIAHAVGVHDFRGH
jgi:hypothetical protein